MRKETIFFCLSLCVFCSQSPTHAQAIASFTVPDINNAIATPVYVDIDQLTSAADSSLVLRDMNEGRNIPFQVEHGYHRFLWWLVKKEPSRKTTTRIFELSMDKRPRHADPVIKVMEENGALLITANKKKVLQYNYEVQYPPKGVDTFFKRSGFIHPLWSPSGNVLTQINPPDHYHHMGIWNPWTDVVYQGKKVDFWNLGDKKGTVRFAHFISKDMGDVFGGFKALQEHVVLDSPARASETIAMNEVWDIKVFNVGPSIWLWDFTSTLNCAATDTVFL
ncbi:MAG TPA: DUF6807 family protein, partial [Chryseolinea sp.]|nr:DUF6807 family protein [Chryseolinea sp.]